MDLFLACLTAWLVVIGFRMFEKHVPLSSAVQIFFFLYVVFCGYLLKPSLNLFFWTGVALLLYCILDDMATSTLNIYIPLLVTVPFALFFQKPYLYLPIFLFFVLFWLLSKWTGAFGEGDVFLLPPLFLMLDSAADMVAALLLSCLLAACVLFPLHWWRKGPPEYPFSPFLLASALLIFTYQDLFWLFVTLFACTGLFLLLHGVRRLFSSR